MAALASFCSKYSQPFCQVLVAAVLREPGEGAMGSQEAQLLGAAEGAGEGLWAASSRKGSPSCRVLSPGSLLSPKICVRNHGGMVLVLSGQVNTWELEWEVALQMPEREREGMPGWFPASVLPKDSCHPSMDLRIPDNS